MAGLSETSGPEGALRRAMVIAERDFGSAPVRSGPRAMGESSGRRSTLCAKEDNAADLRIEAQWKEARPKGRVWPGGGAPRLLMGPVQRWKTNEVFVKRLLASCACACALLLLGNSPLAGQNAPPPPGGAGQNPPDSGQPASPKPQFDYTKLAAPPPLPKVVDVQRTGERGFWIGLGAWWANPEPLIDRGQGNQEFYPARLRMTGNPKYNPDIEIGIAITRHDTMRISYFTSSATSGGPLTQDTQVWTEIYPKGTWVNMNYKIRNARFTYEYLTWPYPVKKSAFRLKTLWAIQYTNVRTGFDAPYTAPTTDSSGNYITYNTTGINAFWSPVVGANSQYWLSKAIRLDATAEGFAFPHHWGSWELNGAVSVRAGRYELQMGVRDYHFRTSPRGDYWIRGTMFGPFVKLRLFSVTE